MSVDGRYVVFQSLASNLVGGDSNSATDIFLRDRLLGTTERVSLSSGGGQANGSSLSPWITPDGRYIGFASNAPNLVDGDTNGAYDAFVRDLQSGVTERVSVDSGGAQGTASSGYPWGPSISGDGRYVVFSSEAGNFVSGDTNGSYDVFLRDRKTGLTWEYCTANSNSTGSPAVISASGSASSGAGDLMLACAPVPNQNGIFFHGANQVQIPFGDGFQCTTGGVTRSVVIIAVGNGASYTYDNSDTKHSLAAFVGATRHFQFWFRDPAAGGTGFNTSNAVSVDIEP